MPLRTPGEKLLWRLDPLRNIPPSHRPHPVPPDNGSYPQTAPTPERPYAPDHQAPPEPYAPPARAAWFDFVPPVQDERPPPEPAPTPPAPDMHTLTPEGRREIDRGFAELKQQLDELLAPQQNEHARQDLDLEMLLEPSIGQPIP